VKKEIKISTLFPQHLFWDVNINALDVQRDKNLIIPRALYMSTKNSFNTDIKKLESIYSSTQIVKHLKNTREKVSNEICELVAKRYSVPLFHRFKTTR